MGKPTGKRWPEVYRKFRDALPDDQKINFDEAPDLDDPAFAQAYHRFLWAQYVHVCGLIDLSKDLKEIKVLSARAESLASQIRMLKVLVSQPGMNGKRPSKCNMSVFEEVQDKPERSEGE